MYAPAKQRVVILIKWQLSNLQGIDSSNKR